MKSWYSITAKGESAVPEVSIFGPIGATWDGEGVTARKFIEDFKALKGDNVTMLVNSPGGSLFDGLAIYTAIAASGKNVTAKVMGLAASAASLVLMAASRIEMPKNTHLMVHKAGNVVAGNADELRAMAEVLDTLDNSIAATYAARSGKPVEDIKAMLDQGDTWLSADEAVEMGFADEATELVTVTAQFDTSQLPDAVRAALAPAAPAAPAAPEPAPAAAALPESLAAALESLAAQAGVQAYLPNLAVDPRITDAASATNVVAEARDIAAFARIAGFEAEAGKLIASRVGLAQAKATLLDMRAAADEHTVIDTAPPPLKPKASAEAEFSVSAIWDDIKAMKAGSTKK